MISDETLKIPVIENKVVLVRIYSDWQTETLRFNPSQMYVPFSYKEEYKIIQGRLSKGLLTLEESVNLPDDAGNNPVILLNPADQDDIEVKKFLGNNVYIFKYNKGSSFMVSRFVTYKQQPHVIKDCDGKPLADCKIEIFLGDFCDPTKASIAAVITDKDGRIEVPGINEDYGRFHILIKAPGYGSFFATVSGPLIGSEITVPAVDINSPYFDRSIWGVVTTPDGQPISGALVGCPVFTTSTGANLPQENMPSGCNILTDEQGRFARTIDVGQSATGKQIPAHLYFGVIVKPVESSEFLTFRGFVQNSQETKIVLQPAGPLRKFIFEDEKGVITNRKILQDLSLYIECEDGNKIRLNYSEWKNGKNLPAGKYFVDATPTTKLKFSPVEVNDQPIVAFQAEGVKDKLYVGQVIDGISGKPMEGVFIASTTSFLFDFTNITSEQWDALQTLPLNPSIKDKALDPLRKAVRFRKITRTDRFGNFQIPVDTNESATGADLFIFFQHNYLTLAYRFFQKARVYPSDVTLFNSDSNSVIQFDTVTMVPGAMVVFEPNYMNEKLRLSVSVSYIDQPKWLSGLLASPKGTNKPLIRFGDRIQTGEQPQQHIFVPANVNFQILMVPVTSSVRKSENDITTPVITNVLNCSPGQILDLGKIPFSTEIPVFVKLIDSSGKPLEGIEVRNGTEDGRLYFSQRKVTDSNGIVRLRVPLNYKISFNVGRITFPPSRPQQSLPFQANSPDDANSIVTFQLTDAIIKDLFDPNVIKDNKALTIPLLKN